MTLLLLGLTEVLLVAVACGLLLLVAPLGAAAGALLFPGLYVRRLHRALISAPLAPVERPTSDPAPGEQPAYRQYFSGQAIADFGSIVRDSRATCQAVAAGAVHEISMISFTSNAAIFTWMFGVVGIVGVVVGACVGAIVVAALVTVHVVLLGILHFAVWSGIGLLRTLDAALLRIRGIRMTCGTCHHRISYPAYRCPSCRRPHTDVRPGVYGVLRRVCTCGTRIPTLLVLGTYRLDALCPYCGQPLSGHVGTTPELVLPLFGARGAGKTRLMVALIRAVTDSASSDGIACEFADAPTQKRYEELLPAMERGRETPPTPTTSPRAYSLRVTAPAGATRLVHIFDVAGERLNTVEATRELRYLANAGLFLFVLDPLGVDGLWRQLEESERSRLAAYRSSEPPEAIFERTFQQIQRAGVHTSSSRLGVAVTKNDLLGGLPPFVGVGHDSRAIEAWLDRQLGLGNLIRTMKLEFGQVRFFFTAAVLDDRGRLDSSVVAMSRWLFDGGKALAGRVEQ